MPTISPDKKPPEDSHGRVVYSRTEVAGANELGATALHDTTRNTTRKISPALKPLLIGFLFLLALILVLGWLSVRQLESVSQETLELERQHGATLSLLLKLRVSATALNNEVRARADMEARGGFVLPTDLRLRKSRTNLEGLLPLVDHSNRANDPEWQKLITDLEEYINVTHDLRRSSLEGFEKFRDIDAQFVGLLNRETGEQNEILAQIERLQARASRSIQIVALVALFTALLVAIFTFREVNRRFGQTLESLEQARKERQFSSQVLEGMVSAVAALDVDYRVLSTNQAFSYIYPEAIGGASLIEVMQKYADEKSEKSRLLGIVLAQPNTDSAYHGRFMLAVDEARERRAFDVYVSPLMLDAGNGRILTLVDATEAADKEAELRRKESLVAVGQATAQVAHEIRNPLGSIRLGVTMLRDTIDDAETLKTIYLVERGINHLHKLTSDVTQFSRQRPLTITSVNLHELLRGSIEMVNEKIIEKGLQLRTEFSDAQVIGEWDEAALRQVLVNLLLNAIDACDKGTSITVSTMALNGRDGDSSSSHEEVSEVLKHVASARIQIKDCGHGMDDEIKDHIFEPFYTTKNKGTGLGLAIAKKIIDQHGGSISVESRSGEGTSFNIDLPVTATQL